MWHFIYHDLIFIVFCGKLWTHKIYCICITFGSTDNILICIVLHSGCFITLCWLKENVQLASLKWLSSRHDALVLLMARSVSPTHLEMQHKLVVHHNKQELWQKSKSFCNILAFRSPSFTEAYYTKMIFRDSVKCLYFLFSYNAAKKITVCHRTGEKWKKNVVETWNRFLKHEKNLWILT